MKRRRGTAQVSLLAFRLSPAFLRVAAPVLSSFFSLSLMMQLSHKREVTREKPNINTD